MGSMEPPMDRPTTHLNSAEEDPIDEALEENPLSADGVRWFLNLVGKYPLLTPEEETDLGRKIKEGKRAIARLSEALGVPEDVIREAVAYNLDSPLLKERYHYPEHFLEGTRRRAHLMGPQVWSDWHVAREALLAHEELVRRNLRLVVSVAKRYGGGGFSHSLMDRIAEGALGLMTAAEKYDWEMGTRFSTYATWWIRQAIVRGLHESGRPVRIPSYLHEEIRQMVKAREALEAELGYPPTPKQIAQRMGEGWDEDKVRYLMGLQAPVQSLDAPLGEGEESDRLFGETIPSPLPLPDDLALEKIFWEKLGTLMSQLKEREREVLTRRFGLDGGPEETLKEVGNSWNVSRERVRQIEAQALGKLRELLREGGLGEPEL